MMGLCIVVGVHLVKSLLLLLVVDDLCLTG